jgi:hypothetical protein
VVNVTDGADVYVRLGPFEFTFCHFRLLRSNDIFENYQAHLTGECNATAVQNSGALDVD